ncbi:MAG: hypothetical protein CSA58_00395 [Micrococcales bacterium]|nr:MAG: hypothetical protein CSB46_02090 [Micrococcales bacterium]PIE28186.1 MAG: hypothetical protein CSA58_00395 [Micrococcales bacterium]
MNPANRADNPAADEVTDASADRTGHRAREDDAVSEANGPGSGGPDGSRATGSPAPDTGTQRSGVIVAQDGTTVSVEPGFRVPSPGPLPRPPAAPSAAGPSADGASKAALHYIDLIDHALATGGDTRPLQAYSMPGCPETAYWVEELSDLPQTTIRAIDPAVTGHVLTVAPGDRPASWLVHARYEYPAYRAVDAKQVLYEYDAVPADNVTFLIDWTPQGYRMVSSQLGHVPLIRVTRPT